MKFKWIGGNGFKDIDLVLAKVMNQNQQLYTGMIITIPDENQQLIRRLQINGNYERYIEPKKVSKPVKKHKKEKKEEDK